MIQVLELAQRQNLKMTLQRVDTAVKRLVTKSIVKKKALTDP